MNTLFTILFLIFLVIGAFIIHPVLGVLLALLMGIGLTNK